MRSERKIMCDSVSISLKEADIDMIQLYMFVYHDELVREDSGVVEIV